LGKYPNKKREGLAFARLGVKYGLSSELERGSFGHFVGAGLVGGSSGRSIGALHQIIGEEISFNFLTAVVRQHSPVYLDTWAEHLAALLDHFLALDRIIDDVSVLEG